jgi:HAD superfamily hydrolase (TIGR01459 family)
MTSSSETIPVISSIGALSACYDAWLCDIWGVMHNGESSFSDAVLACTRFREQGGTVVLISNSPRPSDAVARQLADIGVPEASYDAIVTSGDTTRNELLVRKDQSVFHLGPERDKPLVNGLDLQLVGLENASFVLCSGLYDDSTETPDDYAEMLSLMKQRGLPMLCANPDIQVERGHRLIYCAGALAAAYEQLGGEVIYTGKPHQPIYDRALSTIRDLRRQETRRERILCIGDGIKTDIKGAVESGFDAVFIASALHIDDVRTNGLLDPAVVTAAFSGTGMTPVAAQKTLKW